MCWRLLVVLAVGYGICGGGGEGPGAAGAEAIADAAAKVNRLTDHVEEGRPVPEALTFSADFERIVIVRMTYQTDVLEGLKKAVQQEKIKSAVILSGIGSLVSYHVHVVGNTTFPTKNVFIKGEGPYDLTAVTGYVVDGRVHAHVTFSDEKQALAGHLEPGTRAFTFVIVTLGVFGDEVDLKRLDDAKWR